MKFKNMVLSEHRQRVNIELDHDHLFNVLERLSGHLSYNVVTDTM